MLVQLIVRFVAIAMTCGPLEALRRTGAWLDARLRQRTGRYRTDTKTESATRSITALTDLCAQSPQLHPIMPSGHEASPRISIIMPTHRRAQRLERAIRSVTNQTYEHWELIVVQDGPDAQTTAQLASLSNTESRIVHLQQPWQGGAAARNRGLDVATGEIVCYLDDDNTYFPDYLAAIARRYLEPSCMCAYAAQLWENGNDSRLTYDRFDWHALLDQRMSIDMNVFSHRTSLYRTLGGFDERLLIHIDLDLVARYTASHTPARIPTLAVRYDWASPDRISKRRHSLPSVQMIRDKHRTSPARPLRVLLIAYDYPQLSESYVHTEIRWMQSQGVHVEVFSQAKPRSPGKPTATVHRGELSDCIRSVCPDVIHVHWLSTARQYADTLARSGCPVTVRAHGFDHSRRLALGLAREPWVKKLYLFPSLQPRFASKNPRIAPTPAAFNSALYYPPLIKNRRLVLRAGACLPTKDLGLFIEVAARCPEYRFVLALSSNNSGIELAESLLERNRALGMPAEIVFDLQYEKISEIMREASIYLHTFGYRQPFGQPISVAEAMACGTVPILRGSFAARLYGVDAAMYYRSDAHCARILRSMGNWDDARWAEMEKRCIERAWSTHADAVILPPILHDWETCAFSPPTRSMHHTPAPQECSSAAQSSPGSM